MENISSAHSKSRILATGGCGFSSVTLPSWVLTFMAATTSVLIDAESAGSSGLGVMHRQRLQRGM